MSGEALRVAALEALGVAHGFGTRDSEPPPVLRPRQVHGRAVAVVREPSTPLGDADAVVCSAPGVAVGVVTADCVPLLVSDEAGRRVAAIHAGWRGLAAGVVEAAVAVLQQEGAPAAGLRAAVGPCIGPCCYEVDAPVTGALRSRYGADLAPFVSPSRPEHAWLDLGALARFALGRTGVAGARIAALEACTRCRSERFHSYRRDGSRAGRMVHWIAPRG